MVKFTHAEWLSPDRLLDFEHVDDASGRYVNVAASRTWRAVDLSVGTNDGSCMVRLAPDLARAVAALLVRCAEALEAGGELP
ncbi:hypothetical protein [Comamonas sp. NLF-1-9]|uniref:hypothetical protein n=1 Tax=Comamonas sp. NLF-1-9 TaxID=2853163 RepID=UPI001C4467F6|nr:hypothetical protein [Comamonas sp. NLF-1-9]QXL83270.1 hypothetical protein KUD94_08295 [Comamonas sp. NLF-1-9]